MVTKTRSDSDRLIEFCHKLDARRRLSGLTDRAREVLEEAVSDWEGITSSGILIKGMHGIHSPHSLGVPIGLKKLKRIFPELEVVSKFD